MERKLKEQRNNMEKYTRKFVFNKSLYSMLWIWVILLAVKIIIFTINNLEAEAWHPIGLLYEGGVWDYLRCISLLLVALSFKKTK